MANAIVKISKRAKAILRAHPSKAWKQCIKQASAEYRSGKIGAAPKKYRQTGSSNTKRDKQRKAKPPGKRKSKTGRVYYERRKNRSDRPKAMTGFNTHVPAQIANEMRELQRCKSYLLAYQEIKVKSMDPGQRSRVKAAKVYYRKAIASHKKNITNLKRLI